MLVVDASVLLEILLGSEVGEQCAMRVLRSAETLHAPFLVDLEVTQVLRRLVIAREVPERRALEALDDYQSLRIIRHPHAVLLDRIWALRRSPTAYDVAYVALAEALDAVFLACDSKLARAHGHDARVEVAAV